MITVVMAAAPREGVLPKLPETSPLSAAEAADLYRAMTKDALRAAATSSGDLLVNYREEGGDGDAEAELRAVADELPAVEEPRFEVQVGSTFAARVGNTVTHLLETEGATSVAVLEPDVPMLLRKDADSATMRLRSRDVVLGPAERGRVYLACFTEPLDFADAYDSPAVGTLARRAVDAGLETDFLPQLTKVETGEDLLSLLAVLEARREAGRLVPEYTTSYLDALGLRIEGDDDPALVRTGIGSS